MNERMLEIKALNLSLCLLSMLILVSWSRFIFLFTQRLMLKKSSSTTTACNFIQDSLVWHTLNYINIYYRTIISPINI